MATEVNNRQVSRLIVKYEKREEKSSARFSLKREEKFFVVFKKNYFGC